MAVLCLANDLEDLRSRIDRIVLGLRPDGTAYTCGELGATGSLLALLLKPSSPTSCSRLKATSPSSTAVRLPTSPMAAIRLRPRGRR